MIFYDGNLLTVQTLFQVRIDWMMSHHQSDVTYLGMDLSIPFEYHRCDHYFVLGTL